MIHSVLLMLLIPMTAQANDCSEFLFNFFINQKNQSKKITLCSVSSAKLSHYVSPNCLNSQCKQLKPYKLRLPLKRKGFKAHPGVELCKALNGQYINGKLNPFKNQSLQSFCFFSDGSVLSAGYLYENWKKSFTPDP